MESLKVVDSITSLIYPNNDEFVSLSSELVVYIESINAEIKLYNATDKEDADLVSNLVNRISRKLVDFPQLKFYELINITPRKYRTKLNSLSNNLSASINVFKDDISIIEIKTGTKSLRIIDEIQRLLDDLVLTVNQIKSRRKQTKYTLLVVMLIIAGALFSLGYYYDTDKGFLTNDIVLRGEEGRYIKNENSYTLTTLYKEEFWAGFPSYFYNRHADKFVGKYFYEGEEGKTLETFKILYRNQSRSIPQLISTVAVSVENNKQEKFDWQKLKTRENIIEATENGVFSVYNVSPAVLFDLNYEVLDEDGNVIKKRYYKYTYSNNIFNVNPYYLSINSYKPFIFDGDGKLKQGMQIEENEIPENYRDLFQEIRKEVKTWSDEEITVYHIETISDLEKIADIKRVNTFTINYTYRNIFNENSNKSSILKVEDGIAYYKLKYIPDEISKYYSEPQLQMTDSGYRSGLESLAPTVLSKIDEGDYLVVDRVTVDLTNRERNKFTQMFDIDQVVKPDGYLILYVDVINAWHGTNSLNIKLNNTDENISFESIRPEVDKFSYPSSLVLLGVSEE